LAFFVPISASTPHIYLSALLFAPEHSLVTQKFSSRFPNTLSVIEGRPAQWPFTLFTAEHGGSVEWLVFSSDEKTFAFISSFHKVYICDSGTGHLISGPFKYESSSLPEYACFSPNGTHILVGYGNSGVVWDIERGEKQFRIKGQDFVFIQCGCWYGSIASIYWIDGFSIPVKLWDVENGTPKSSTLFEVMGGGVTQFSPDGQFLAVGRRSEDVIELWNVEDGKNTQ